MNSATLLQRAELSLEAARAARPDTPAGGHDTPAGARDAAEQVEGFFITMMIEAMFAGVETDGMFGGGHGEKVFRSLMFDEYGKAVARSGTLGLADSVLREILRLQEAQKP